jgi:alkanesulfonate monooxygenase SsuD/methylene tetrahydromethanopterin reductase-like flavin-dependent oxidoreductase (luciferase family)
MEFGIFHSGTVLDSVEVTDPAGAEHQRLWVDVEAAIAADKAGFKYSWATEHHFLEEYSHLSASEVWMAFVAGKTERIHLGSGIWNLTPPVNAPARVAERVAMMDHLSKGRFEFGTGRGSSSAEFKGFGIPDGDTTRDMYDEVLPELFRMWNETEYSYDGKWFSMPPRNVLPKLYSLPHPPVWVACGNPPTFAKAAQLGLGALCFALGNPKQIEPLVAAYKGKIGEAEPVGAYVNDNVACVSRMVCLEDGKRAREVACGMGSGRYQSLVFKWLDSIPKPPHLPEWPQLLPEPTMEELEWQIENGYLVVGDPDDCAKAIQSYADIGCDQLIFGTQNNNLPIEITAESLETFGKYVIPQFDKDPVHSTTRYREAALAASSASRV